MLNSLPDFLQRFNLRSCTTWPTSIDLRCPIEWIFCKNNTRLHIFIGYYLLFIWTLFDNDSNICRRKQVVQTRRSFCHCRKSYFSTFTMTIILNLTKPNVIYDTCCQKYKSTCKETKCSIKTPLYHIILGGCYRWPSGNAVKVVFTHPNGRRRVSNVQSTKSIVEVWRLSFSNEPAR